MKILALSDQIDKRIYNPNSADSFSDIDIVFCCGDLPYYYVEYVVDTLRKPVYYVHGNHDPLVEYSENEERTEPGGAVNLHQELICVRGHWVLGFEGALRYKEGSFLYSQLDMWLQVFGVLPKLFWNKLRHGKYFDILVTHAPSRNVQDREDLAHQGFNAFRWLLKTFKPAYHFHGHIHIYGNNESYLHRFMDTIVINSCGHRVVELAAQDQKA